MEDQASSSEVYPIIMFDSKDSHMYSYKPWGRFEWSRMQEFSEYAKFGTSIVSGKHIYIIHNQKCYQLEYSDPAAKWKQMSSMIEDHGARPPAAVLNGSIYVCGSGAKPSRSVKRYDAALDRWNHMCDMKIERYNSCIVATEGHIYCMGGENDRQSVERFDERSEKWEIVESSPKPIVRASAAFVKNRVYVAEHDGVLCYDIQNDSWSEMKLTNQYPFIKYTPVKILAVDDELYIIGKRSEKTTAIFLLKPEPEQMNLVDKFEGKEIDVNNICLNVWHLLELRASNKDKNKELNMKSHHKDDSAYRKGVNSRNVKIKLRQRHDEVDMNAKRRKLQEYNEARRLMDIEFAKIKSGTSETFTLCHKKLITSDAEYFSALEPNFSLKELKLRNCNVDGDFLHTLKEKIPHVKIGHVNFSGNNQIDLPALTDLLTLWKCNSLDLSDIEFDEKKMNDLQDIPKLPQLKTLILDYSSFPMISNAMKHVVELLQSSENLSLVSSTISTDQLILIAKKLLKLPIKRIKLQSLNLSHVQLGDEGFIKVCKIINKTNGMKKLSLSNSGLTAEKLEVFSKEVTQTIEDLDLGLNKNIGSTDLKKIIEIVKNQHVKKLNLTGLALNQDALKQLTESDIQITELNISENLGICLSDVGELAAKLKIQNLDISKCWHTVDDLEKLANSMKNHKLDWLNVTESFRVLNENKREKIRSMLLKVAKKVRIEKARSLTQ